MKIRKADMLTRESTFVLLTMVFGCYAFLLKADCKWNYTLQRDDHKSEVQVEMEDLGNDCHALYEEIPTYEMKSSPRDITVNLEKTINPSLQEIKISWRTRSGILKYLLVMELKHLESDEYFLSKENTRCILVKLAPAKKGLQVRGGHTLGFDCIQVPTGTMLAVLRTTIRIQDQKTTDCDLAGKSHKACFVDPLYLAKNIDADCCKKNVSSRDLKLWNIQTCRWLISVKSPEFSSLKYELRELNRVYVSHGSLLPTRASDVFARYLDFEKPGIYILRVSFWCSFDYVNISGSHNCTSVQKMINVTSCNKTQNIGSLDGRTEARVAGVKKSDPTMLIVVVNLASVAVGIIIIAVIFWKARKGSCQCCQRSYLQTQNNLRINVPDISDALIQNGDVTQPKHDCHGELKEKLTA